MRRRGLSTMVGAVFFVIAATTTITYVSYNMNVLENFSETAMSVESENLNRGSEKIEITSARIDNGKFNMTVTNAGSLPVHLTRLWVTNQDQSLAPTKQDLDEYIDPGKQKYNIGDQIDADSSNTYSLKLVTERGNVATYAVSSDSSTMLELLVPAQVLPSSKIRATLIVVNNSTQQTTIADLTPQIANNAGLVPISGPNPSSVKDLPRGKIATFDWEFDGPILDQTITFNASFAGAPQGMYDLETTKVKALLEAETASASQWAEQATRIGILLSGIPTPMDASSNQGLAKFGMGIINPLDRNIEVYSVALDSPAIKLFETNPTPVEPTTGWTVDTSSTGSLILWEAGTSGPIIVPPESVKQFRVILDIKLPTTESLVLVEALTSEGKMSSIYTVTSDDLFPTIAIYYTSKPSNPSQNWGYLLPNVKGGQIRTFNATLENAGLGGLGSSVSLNILIPKDFTNVQFTPGSSYNNLWANHQIVNNPDGSTFVKAETLGGMCIPAPCQVVLQFDAIPPAVTATKLYVFSTVSYYPLWTGPRIAAAVSEAGVEVIP